MKQYTINDIEVWADGLDHPECVAVHSDGSLWAGGEGGQVYHISSKNVFKEVVNTGGFVLGLAFSPEGWLAICDLKKKCVWRFDISTGELKLLASEAGGRKFQTPNFPVFDKQGNLYVSDSGEFRKHNGCIYKFSPGGNGEIWHAGPFPFANGMALSKDQQTLFVVSTWLPGVEAIDIQLDGTAGDKRTIVELPKTCPDGIAIDEEENLYVSCYAPNVIYKIDRRGELLTLIEDWESHTICNPTNIAFGGKDNRDLFIANLGRWHIAKLRLDTGGLLLAGQLP